MNTIRIIKVVLYPIAGVLQFFVLPSVWWAIMLCILLWAVAALNLKQLLTATGTDSAGNPANDTDSTGQMVPSPERGKP